MSDNLLQVVKNNTDASRWDALERLMERGYTLQGIAEKLDMHPNALIKWRYRNKDKYATKKNDDKPSLSHRNSPANDGSSSLSIDKSLQDMTDDEIDRIPYGDLPATGYISPLEHMAWGEKYLNHTWDAPYLKEMGDEIQNRHTVLILIGRHHGKTWMMIKLFIMFLLHQQRQILCMTNKAKREDIWRMIDTGLRRAAIRRDYGDVIVSSRAGNNTDIFLTDQFRYYTNGSDMDGPNFKAITAGPDTKQVGLHVKEGWMHLEDPTQDIAVSEETEERLRHWYDRTVKYIASNDTKTTGTGTRKDPKDFYWYLQEKHYWPVLIKLAFEINNGRLPKLDEVSVSHEYKIITDWPHGVGTYSILGCPDYPLERLLYEFIYHPDAAEAELNNNPLPRAGNYFDVSTWIEQDLPENYHKLPKYIVVDPAFGGSSTSSKTAIIVIMIHQFRLWVIDMFIGRLGLTKKENYIVAYANNYDPKQILIEDNYGQISTRYRSKSQLMSLRGLTLFNAQNDKKERIAAMDFPFRKSEIIIYESCPFKSDLKTEFLSFSMEDGPTTIRQKYNGLDALSSGYERLKQFLSKGGGFYVRTWN